MVVGGQEVGGWRGGEMILTESRTSIKVPLLTEMN